MQFKTAIRNFISNNRIAHRCFVSICARFSMRLYSLQTYLSLEDLRAKGRARLWRRVMVLLERPALEKIVIANGKATFFYVDSCCFGVETNTISLSSTLFSHGDYEQNETRLIAKIVKPGWTVIDAGANFGWHSIHLSRLVGPQGKVLAFEPVPDSYEELRANILLNDCQNLEACPIALGSTEGTINLYLPAIHHGLGAASQFLDMGKKTEVPMVPLDDFLDRHVITRVDFIKADIEGGELNLLRGAKRLLEGCRPSILIEVVDIHCRRFGHTPEDVLSFLLGRGYKGHYIDESGGLVEFDSEHPPNGNYFFRYPTRAPTL